MRLANPSRPTTAIEGLAFIEQYIVPTLERCEELQSHDKIIAGGPVSGAVALDLIVKPIRPGDWTKLSSACRYGL
jgi:hypothetical protein